MAKDTTNHATQGTEGTPSSLPSRLEKSAQKLRAAIEQGRNTIPGVLESLPHEQTAVHFSPLGEGDGVRPITAEMGLPGEEPFLSTQPSPSEPLRIEAHMREARINELYAYRRELLHLQSKAFDADDYGEAAAIAGAVWIADDEIHHNIVWLVQHGRQVQIDTVI